MHGKGMLPRAQTMTSYQPRKAEEGEKVVEVVKPRAAGSFDFGDHGGGAACETLGAGAVDPLDVGMLGNLWQRMQLR